MDVLIRPHISEKTSLASETLGTYTFIVDKRANKIQIKNAIEDRYGVTVDTVRTMIIPGKARSRFTKTAVIKGIKPSYKKAIVQLLEGDEIDFYANI